MSERLMPAFTDSTPLAHEHGERVMIRAAIANLAHLEHTKVRETLERCLVKTFGGYTRYYGQGGWRDESGETMREHVSIYEVSMLPSGDYERFACLAFRIAGKNIGEKWVHLERHTFEALHHQVNR